jgi:uncharacterized membrane protein YfbV (UPF0208 family)
MHDHQSKTSRQLEARIATELFMLELTIEDILHIHRAWISDLYATSHKWEVEVVELLCERHLTVS